MSWGQAWVVGSSVSISGLLWRKHAQRSRGCIGCFLLSPIYGKYAQPGPKGHTLCDAVQIHVPEEEDPTGGNGTDGHSVAKGGGGSKLDGV